MKTIALTKGYVAIVDDEDFENVNKFSWAANVHSSRVYVSRFIRIEGKRRQIYLHRMLMNEPVGLLVDHWNGNPLDNRRCNLRLATKTQNNANNQREVGLSGFRGVTHRGEKKSHLRPWQAQISIKGVNHVIGCFDNVRQAAEAYDNEARRLFGKFAKTNFPIDGEFKAGKNVITYRKREPHSIEELQYMVEFCRDHHRSPAHWLALLARARLIQIKREVRAKHKAELEAKRAAVIA